MYRYNCRMLILLLLVIVVGCQPGRFASTATVTIVSSPISTAEQGRIFFVRSESIQSGYEDHCDNLWVMNLDGSQVRQLTTDEPPGIGYYIPDDKPRALVFASATQVVQDTDLVQQIPIPEECQIPPSPEYPNNRVFDFKFSSTGRYVSFTVGNYECGGSVLRVLDRGTGACFTIKDNDRLIKWLSDDRALVAMKSCEYGAVSLYDLSNAQTRLLGYGTIKGWNQDQTAFFVTIPDRIGWEDVLWAYDVWTNTFVHQSPRHVNNDQPEKGQTETAIGWTSDGTHLLYASRRLSYTYGLTFSLPSTTTFGPAQLYIVDNLGQNNHPLVDDLAHNYFARGQNGEQMIIQRTLYQPFSIPTGPVDWNTFNCPLSGLECSDSEYFLLDWRTGELTPWMSPQTPTVTSVVNARDPDLNSIPIYRASDSSFALYSGNDDKGLWQVSATGEQILLVADGHHFVYVEK
jgi:hypothetical protein